MKYTNKYITIKAWDSVAGWIEKDQMARVYNKVLAVHPRFDDKSIFNITHVPTGFCLGHDFSNEKDAITILKLCLEGYDWNFTTREDAPLGFKKWFNKIIYKVCGCQPHYDGITNVKQLQEARPVKKAKE